MEPEAPASALKRGIEIQEPVSLLKLLSLHGKHLPMCHESWATLWRTDSENLDGALGLH